MTWTELLANRGTGRLLIVSTLSALLTPFAASQDFLWTQQYGSNDGENFRCAASDDAEGVFVAGASEGTIGGPSVGQDDAWLARIDRVGTTLWTLQFGSDDFDRLNAGAKDGSGGVFLCGHTQGALAGPLVGAQDAWVSGFDADGAPTWSAQIGSTTFDSGLCVAPDGQGGAFVGGMTEGALYSAKLGGQDAWFARFDGSGSALWTRQLGTNTDDSAHALAPDAAGGVFVAGITRGLLGGPSLGDVDLWLARYSADGAQLWKLQTGTILDDSVHSAIADGSGGVYLCGSTLGDFGAANAGDRDGWVARSDATGNPLWVRQVGSSAFEELSDIAPDGAGGVFACGRTLGVLGGASFGANDAWLVHFDGAGNMLDLKQLGSAGLDGANALAECAPESVFIGGITYGDIAGPNQGYDDAWLARYGTCGTVSAHCVASATSIAGCKAALSMAGTPSMGNPGTCSISSGSIPGNNIGIGFLSTGGAADHPFGSLGGSICMQGPIFRTAAKTSGGTAGACNGQYTFPFADLIAASADVKPGAEVRFQAWARDPANPDGFLLSEALEFVVCP